MLPSTRETARQVLRELIDQWKNKDAPHEATSEVVDGCTFLGLDNLVQQAQWTLSAFGDYSPLKTVSLNSTKPQRDTRLSMYDSQYALHASESRLAPKPQKTKKLKKLPARSLRNIQFLDEATDEVQNGALLDLLVTPETDEAPAGYLTLRNRVPSTSKGGSLFFHVKKEADWNRATQRPCVSGIILIRPNDGEFIPPGFSAVKHKGKPISLDSSQPLYLCIRRSREGNPLVGVDVISARDKRRIPSGFTIVERSPRHHVASFAGCFVVIKHRLESLECLRPRGFRPGTFYSTAATITPADIGNLHILDRSNHPMLSPYCIRNRMELTGKTVDLEATLQNMSFAEDTNTVSSVDLSLSSLLLSSFPHDDSHGSKSLALNFIPSVMGSIDSDLEMRTHILTPVLTALYLGHGSSRTIAIDGLTRLLESGFFDDGVVLDPLGGRISPTLLDIAVQSVCDVLLQSSLESLFISSLEFFAKAIDVSNGNLHERTTGFLVRCFMFVFYFGSTVDAPQRSTNRSCSFGGYTEQCRDGFKHLVSTQAFRVISALQSCCNSENDVNPRLSTEDWISELLDSAIDEAIHQSKQETYLRFTWQQIYKSGGSELFWHDMVRLCGPGIYSSLPESLVEPCSILFGIICSITKAARAGIQADQAPYLVSRDVKYKEFCLDLVHHFLECVKSSQSESTPTSFDSKHERTYYEKMICCTRRIIVPTLLLNRSSSFRHSELFSASARILSLMWQSKIYRSSIKLELAILFETFHLHTLQSQRNFDQCTHLSAQAIYSWIKTPQDFLSFCLNFDYHILTDSGCTILLPMEQTDLLRTIVASCSSLAERSGYTVARAIQKSSLIGRQPEIQRSEVELLRRCRKAAFQNLLLILRNMATICSLCDSGGCQMEQNSFLESLLLSGTEIENLMGIPTNYPQESRRSTTLVALDIAEQKSLRRAIDFLSASGAITATPQDIATFLRLYQDQINPNSIGEYLGETGHGSGESQFWESLRYHFVRSSSFVGMPFLKALRVFLTDGGFCLPKEAQKIDRIIETFSRCFFEDNAGDNQCCPFRNSDSIYVLSFACIMLNTDLNATSRNPKKKSPPRMTCSDFVRNLKGTDLQYENIPVEYLEGIYNDVKETPIVEKYNNEARTFSDQETNTGRLESLLRGTKTASINFAPQTKGDAFDMERTLLAVRSVVSHFFSNNWQEWHAVVSATLDIAHIDQECLCFCADALAYATMLSSALEIRIPLSAFLEQMEKLDQFVKGQNVFEDTSRELRKNAVSVIQIRETLLSHEESYSTSLFSLISEWNFSFRERLNIYSTPKLNMVTSVEKLIDGSFLLTDPSRRLLLEGFLDKRSVKTGRRKRYRFYLFSDVLLYALKSDGQHYNIREEFPLHHVKVVDWFPPATPNKIDRATTFQVYHPRKSFHVICESREEKQTWIHAIRGAIQAEFERKASVEACRAAVVDHRYG